MQDGWNSGGLPGDPMRVGMLTREWPPTVYGGAGVHVAQLVTALTALSERTAASSGRGGSLEVEVHCFADGHPQREGATAHTADVSLAAIGANPSLLTLSTGLAMAAAVAGVDVVHSHTWYAQLAGHVAATLHGIPHVVTTHSLEPLRPWKAEQLGGGYAVSSWCERVAVESAAAVVAVSAGMRQDVLSCYPQVDPARVHVITNGIDVNEWAPAERPEVLAAHGIDPARPIVIFVGRVTRQKGVPHLLRAARRLPPEAQLVLCAGAADTPELDAEVQALVAELSATRTGVHWIPGMLRRADLIALLSAATVFVCPSVYEPLGIVNLEAMACATAVVASAVGGIPEVVEHGVTGLLVDYSPDDADSFEAGLAAAVAQLLEDPARAEAYGAAGRRRAAEHFSWTAVAEQTLALYRSVL